MSEIRLRDIEGYKEFKTECEFFRCEEEYPGWKDTEKYAIITDKPLEELMLKYPQIINAMMPVIILDPRYANIRNKSISNNRKYKRINRLYGCFLELEEDLLNDDQISVVEPVSIPVSYEISEAMKLLTETQKRRVVCYFYHNMSYKEISDIENVDESSVRESINTAIRKFKKYFLNTP